MEPTVKRIHDALWEVPRHGAMRVPARIYASEKMLKVALSDHAIDQAVNVACLPGIVGASLAMPDLHWGYGFPIGGVAAFDLEEGVISPGGVGYDINCGVRLMACNLDRPGVAAHMTRIVNQLFRDVPSGVGSSGSLSASRQELREVATRGSPWAIARGHGVEADASHTEEGGCMRGANPDAVSDHAWKRAEEQLGTLGAGNHFLEVGYVSEVYDAATAAAFGLHKDQVTISIHCGSRGFGHQVCDDFLVEMDRASRKYGIELPDRQLACAPITSPEGEAYLGAMRCAVNYAFANRQVIAHLVRGALAQALDLSLEAVGLRTVYEVAHNIAKIEEHTVGSVRKRVCVHRKGATRAFPAGQSELPAGYRTVGQPVLIPGDMGRCSYVLVGTARAMQETFGSTCHGAGRAMSRKKALGAAQGRDIIREMSARGVVLRVQSRQTAGEEIPEAYKDVSEVVDVCQAAGISKKVAQLRPLGCIKG
jgi:tRNA-splicing ligase RtcB